MYFKCFFQQWINMKKYKTIVWGKLKLKLHYIWWQCLLKMAPYFLFDTRWTLKPRHTRYWDGATTRCLSNMVQSVIVWNSHEGTKMREETQIWWAGQETRFLQFVGLMKAEGFPFTGCPLCPVHELQSCWGTASWERPAAWLQTGTSETSGGSWRRNWTAEGWTSPGLQPGCAESCHATDLWGRPSVESAETHKDH